MEVAISSIEITRRTSDDNEPKLALDDQQENLGNSPSPY